MSLVSYDTDTDEDNEISKEVPDPENEPPFKNPFFRRLPSHDGRIRSRPHVDGEWACFLYCQIDPNVLPKLLDLPLSFKPCESFHISLSKLFCTRYEDITTFRDLFTRELSLYPSFDVKLDTSSLTLFLNEEKTRNFFGYSVCNNNSILESVVDTIDDILEKKGHSTFYDPPHFHVSTYWSIGDVENYEKSFPNESVCININELIFKCGHKRFSIPLKGK